MAQHGAFVWYELATTDVADGRSFYQQIAGWTARDAGVNDMAYLLFQAADVPVAGLMELTPEMLANGAQPCWSGYVAVDDVETTAAQAVTLGGTMYLPPTEIPNVGRFSVIADPHGAVILPFRGQGAAPPGPPPGTPGHFGWHELMAGDGEAAFAFYAALFGWTRSAAVDMGAMGTYQCFAHGGRDIGGMMTKPAQMPGRPHWRYYLQVASAGAAAARVQEAGGAIVSGPHPVPGGSWVVQARDRQGVVFALVGATE